MNIAQRVKELVNSGSLPQDIRKELSEMTNNNVISLSFSNIGDNNELEVLNIFVLDEDMEQVREFRVLMTTDLK